MKPSMYRYKPQEWSLNFACYEMENYINSSLGLVNGHFVYPTIKYSF